MAMDEYRRRRVQRLQERVGELGLDAMLVTSQDAIYYLSGASYKPVERPFFIIVKPSGSPELVVPRLEYEHMLKVEGFGEIRHYFEYPSIPGQNWYDYIAQSVGESAVIGIEPALYFDDIGGFRHSDTVLVTRDGFERITQYPDDLESLIVRDKRTIKKIKGFVVRKAVNIQ